MEAVDKMVAQAKWDKGKLVIQELAERCKDASDLPSLCHKDLERKRGFLVHLAMTLTNLVPFFKGLHLTIDLWRPL